MKFIIFSDIHLHNYSGGVDPESRLSKRLLIQKNLLQQILDLAIQEDAIILFGGDLVHAVGNVPVEVLNVIHWFFEECKKLDVKFYAVEGNHDQIIRKNCPASHSILSPFQNREQRDKDLVLLKPTIRFVDYDQMDEGDRFKDFDIVIIHAQPDLINKHKHHMEGVNWKLIAKNNRLVFFGHDHTRRELSKNCYVIGSPMQLTMNDVGEDRGCYLVNSEDWKVEFIKLDYPELKRLEKIESKEETKFEERIKATSFQDILVEWLDREQKPQSYLDLIQKDITDKVQVAKNFFNGRITEIYLQDFMSIEEIKVQIKNGFWLVMGENGTGKTSFFEGIYWILFDCLSKTIAKPDVVKNRPTKQKEAIGELCLVDDKQVTKIIRSSKNGLEIWQDKRNLVDGMTKVQAQEFLEKHILGFDKNTYLASCYFSQEQLLTLAQLGDTDKANMITGLLGFETYDSLYVQMDLKKKEVTLQLDLEEQRSVRLNNEIWKNSEQQKNLKEQIEMFTKQQCSVKDEQSKVNQQIAEFTTLLGNIIVPTVTTEDIDVSLSALNVHKTVMSTKQRTLQEDGQLRTQDLRKQLSILQKDLATIIQEQNKIDKEKTKSEIEKQLVQENIAKHEAIINSLKKNKCSYCGTILNKEDLEKHLAEEQAEIYVLVNKSIPRDNLELDKQLEKLYDQEAQIQELIENINKQILESDAEIKSLIALNFAEITKIECDIQELQVKKGQAIKEVTLINSSKASLTQQIKQLEQRKLTLVNQLQQVNVDDKVAQLKKLENDFDNLDAEKLCINDKKVRLVEHLDIYTFWHNSFGSKGIRPLLLDKFVNSFNEIIKHFCYEVSNGEFIVQFSPTSTTRAGLERNKLGLEICYKDKIVSYASLSGGEKTRVALPLCFGLNKWISSKYGIKNGLLGIIALDEMFSHTDEKFRESVSHMLYNEGQTRAIFVIDHSDILAGYTNQVWNVTKENDTTLLQIT